MWPTKYGISLIERDLHCNSKMGPFHYISPRTLDRPPCGGFVPEEYEVIHPHPRHHHILSGSPLERPSCEWSWIQRVCVHAHEHACLQVSLS